ncbi:MAG: hypothetical protein OQJ81_00540, partial [Melioribacteraceae bacterium]|nr:hypothetical protein [Melioribacteraceae bacterium]
MMQITEILKYVEDNSNSAFFYTPNIYNGGKSYFFKKPWKILKARTKEEVESLLVEVDKFSQNSKLIGFAAIPYEIGYYFQPKEIRNSYLENSELCFYFYEIDNVEIIDSDKLGFDYIEEYLKKNNEINNLELDITRNEYIE